MWDTGKVNTGKENDRTVKLSKPAYRIQLLKGVGLTVSEEVVQAVIDYCSGNSHIRSLYQLYTNALPTFQAAKGTIYKIKDLYESGALAEYVQYLDSERLTSSSGVDVPTQLEVKRTTQPAKSESARPGVLAPLPAPFNMAVIKNLLDNELAKTSMILGQLDQVLKAKMAWQLNG